MNGRYVLYAISGTDEQFLLESQQFTAIGKSIRDDINNKRRISFCVVAVAVICAAVFGIVKRLPRSFVIAPTEMTDSQTRFLSESSQTEGTMEMVSSDATIGGDARTTVSDAPDVGSAAQTQTTAASLSSAVTVPDSQSETPIDETTGEPDPHVIEPPSPSDPVSTAPFVDASTEPTTVDDDPVEDPGGSAGAVFTSVVVSYSEARDKFAHPIVPCSKGDFLGYKIGIVSKNGDIDSSGSFCLSVTYIFERGSIGLQDQDRLTGSSASTTGEECSYRGRVFYVQPSGSFGDQNVRVGYYPSWDAGIAYEAYFDGDVDVNEIMDLIISVEI